jgi:hypothetical protein
MTKVRRLGAKMAKNVQIRNQAAVVSIDRLSPDELKSTVRDGLVSMTIAERAGFLEAIEAEMALLGLDIRAYLIPLGIPGRSPDDLTPTEVGHLLRYLKINVPKSARAIQRAVARFGMLGDKPGQTGGRLAA